MRFHSLVLLISATLALLLTGCPTTAIQTVDAASSDAATGDAGTNDDAAAIDAAHEDDAGPPPDVGYLEDIHPIFEAAGCATFACHGATQAGAGLIVYMPSARVAYDDMIERASVLGDGVVVRPGVPDESRLVLHAEETHVPMGILTAEQAELLRHWVEVGAVYSRTGSSDPGEVPAPAEPTSCDVSSWRGWSPLPEACVPRCTADTWDAIVACRDAADVVTCQNEAIAADTTPMISVPGGTDVFDLDCDLCLTWTTRSCISDSCTHELLAFDRCSFLRTGDPCTAESTALTSCRSAHPEIVTCQRARDPLCVAAP